ncbi:MAG: nucleoside hydrolase [Kordiimonadaceae bacterium]|nr:nucleoside hydrolase [Kordiimonadaceae bacterium]
MQFILKWHPNKLTLLFSALFICIGFVFLTIASEAKEKIIVDVDLHHFTDDHEALIMLTNLHKQKKLQLMGVTLVAGNQWIDQIENDTLKAVERLGMADELPVFKGADRPLLHDPKRFEQAKILYGLYNTGAWTVENKIKNPPDGGPEYNKIQNTHAVDFIINTVRENPGEITIAALGPLTNLALAIRKAPDISAKIKKIIYMGGAFFVSGNVTGSAEFNWWFDAEAAAIVLNEKIDHVIVPLDATDQLLLDKKHYERMIKNHPDHINTKTFMIPKFGDDFERDAKYKTPVWDALVAAYICDSSIVEEEKDLLVGVNYAFGPDYGRSYFYPVEPYKNRPFPIGTKNAKVLLKLNNEKFWSLFERLMFYKDQ